MTKFDRLKAIGETIETVLLVISIISAVVYMFVVFFCAVYWLSVFVKFTIYTMFGWDFILA